MKLMKKIILILLSIGLIYSGGNSLYNYSKIKEAEKAYLTYYEEDADIRVVLKGGINSLAAYKYFPSMEYYEEQLKKVENIYNRIENEEYIENLDISYFMEVQFYDTYQYLVGHERFDALNIKIKEGRTFNQEEIDNGKHVVILNEVYKGSKDENIQIGDKIKIKNRFYLNEELSEIEYEVIGFYDCEEPEYNGYDEYLAFTYMYVPNSTIPAIYNKWVSEMDSSHDISYYTKPYGILRPIFTCNSEREYDQVKESLNKYLENDVFSFTYYRIDKHSKRDLVSAKEEYEDKYENSLLQMIFFTVLLTAYIFYYFIKNKIEKNKFEKSLMKEKEKNVQDVFQMNQETHKLKHDMKHFLIHLSSLIENKELDKSLNLIHEYYGDIESLEIPVYTRNPALDILINHYSKKAKKMNINFTYSGNLIEELNVNERKLFILLSNALDNAFTHCDEQKAVNMNVTYVEPYYRFVIVNTFKKTVTNKKDRDHGYGIVSMKNILKEINGEMSLDIQDDLYSVTILIPTTSING